MPWSEKGTPPSDQRVTSRYFDKATKSSQLPINSNMGSDALPITKTPLVVRPLPRAQVEVVIPPYRPKRKLAPSAAIAEPPKVPKNTLDLSKFAYAPPRTPARHIKTAVVRVVPHGPLTVSRFFASNFAKIQRSVTPTTLHHSATPKDQVAAAESSRTKKSRKRKASASVPTDLNNEKKVKLDVCACQTLGEHLQAAKPKLIQALVADDPWRLIIAVGLLNKTRGEVSIPVFWEIMKKWPTPEDLAMASSDDLSQVMAKLGFQNTRAKRFIELSLQYLTDPPKTNRLHKSRCPTSTPKKRTPKKQISLVTTVEDSTSSPKGNRKKEDILQTPESVSSSPIELHARYPPTPISHLPGVGRYALDSYRIFSPTFRGGGAPRDEQRCLQNLLSPCDDSKDPPEWQEVLPEDKELRKYLIWRWALEGVHWEPGKGVSGKLGVSDLWNLPHWS